MKMLFPNYTDKEDFLFYPITEVVKTEDEFKEDCEKAFSNIFIFANYLHKSWWYGFKIEEKNTYKIGIIPYCNSFITITDSLACFIKLYLEDSPVLYEF